MSKKRYITLQDHADQEEAVRSLFNVAIREQNPGGPNIVQWDGSPATPEQIEAYERGEYNIHDAAPHLPKEPWER